ncbi:NDP-hexose 2,3-dehydratase family protein [Amycolatopsis sp. NPDC051061]|uniref:NDP-hexose 2,3-dehydratase family protein n=1 Tax=Amycolatopsis sp. NPDC051061 TaxID=3155042 RepID=UPI00341A9F76
MASPLEQEGSEADIVADLAVSAATTRGFHLSTVEFDAWLAERCVAYDFEVSRVPFDELDHWTFADDSGNLTHRSGRFFTVEGLRVGATDGAVPEWHQPIINQPEIGILGIVAKRFGGVLHFLMQAKMEPGNVNLVQLSPTVQATKSNYRRAHGGNEVAYLHHFIGPRRGKVIVDVLQSEHGSWFYRKRNRNMVVEVAEHVEVGRDFCWLTLGQINELLARDYVVNMDSRTVLSCLPASSVPAWSRDAALPGAHRSTHALLRWLTERQVDSELDAQRVRLTNLPEWIRTDWEISRGDGRFFSVVGVSVRAGTREVSSWHQPLIEQHGYGIVAFVVKEFRSVLHVLVRATMEAGFLGAIELGPTVQCVPANYAPGNAPFLLDYVMAAGPERIRYAAFHSEEGGRFRNAASQYMIIEADETLPKLLPADYTWVAAGQLAELLRHSHYVNVQARSLVAFLKTLP